MKIPTKLLLLSLGLTALIMGCNDDESPTSSDNGDKKVPSVTSSPKDVVIEKGKTANFSIDATGDNITYLWQADERDITEATDKSYKKSDVTPSDSGTSYRCIISNDAGSDTSDNAILHVVDKVEAPTITTQPLNNSVTENSSVTFSVEASGVGIAYQWYKNGKALNGATGKSYIINRVTTADNSATFYCIMTNSGGSKTSKTVTLTVTKKSSHAKYRGGMVLIPAGGASFQMGDSTMNSIEGSEFATIPVHTVKFTKSFYMDTIEVTTAMYVKMLNWAGENSHVTLDSYTKNPKNSKAKEMQLLEMREDSSSIRFDDDKWEFYAYKRFSEDLPMGYVNWYGAAFYCNILSIQEGLTPAYNQETWECDLNANGYRLPTEAEWEFACRGGTTTPWYWGDDSSETKAREYEHFGQRDVELGATKKPNPYGLYDMAGNAYEICSDPWGRIYRDETLTNPYGPVHGESAKYDVSVHRKGGSRHNDVDFLKSSVRHGTFVRSDTWNDVGFRVILPVE